jgi:hypothetical protein
MASDNKVKKLTVRKQKNRGKPDPDVPTAHRRLLYSIDQLVIAAQDLANKRFSLAQAVKIQQLKPKHRN